MEVLGNLLDGGHDEAHVRVFGFAQRRGDTDVDGVEVADDGEIGGRAETLFADELGDFCRGNVLHMRFAAIQAVDFGCQHVDAGNVETGLGELDRQRQADIAQPDDAHAGGFVFNFSLQAFEGYGLLFRGQHMCGP